MSDRPKKHPRRAAVPNLGPGVKAAPPPKLLDIPLASIERDADTQSRVEINRKKAEEYAEMIADMDPVTLFRDQKSAKLYIGDGWHRIAAAEIAGLESIRAEVRSGAKRDAVLHSLGANGKHGVQRSNVDKRKAVMTMLGDSEWKKWSDRAIARQCVVSSNFVSDLRRSLSSDDSENPSRTYVDKHGNVREMRTSAIGRKPEPHPSQPASTLGHSHGAMANLTPIGAPSDAIPQGVAVGAQVPDAAAEAQGAQGAGPAPDFPPEVLREAEEERRAQAAPPKLADAQWEEAGGPEDADSDPESDDLQPDQAGEAGGRDDGVGQEDADAEAWILGLDVYRDLPERTRPRFAHDCRLWAAIDEPFKAFQRAIRPHLDESRADAGRRVRAGEYIPLDNTLSFFDLTVRYQKTRHPRAWSVCNHCKGEGEGGFGEPCGGCRGKGYRVN